MPTKEGAARDLRLYAAATLGPALDVLGYAAANHLGSSPYRSQLLSFLAVIGLIYLPRFARRAPSGSERLTAALHLIAVTALIFFLRSGVFALAVSGWGWPGEGAIVLVAIGTAMLIRPGYEHCGAYSNWRLGEGAGWRSAAIGMVAVAVALRLIYSARVELLPEETYYWNYARHLDIGYLDHPPMVGWLIAAGTQVFGDAEFGVRSGAILSGALATFFAYRLTRELFGAPSALVAVVLAQTLPFFFLSALLMTPDAPLTAAWSAALYYSARALVLDRGEAWWRAGVCFGLGLLCKYTIALLGLSVLVFMVIDPGSRRWLRRREPYLAALIAAAIFAPVIVWNAQHEWASFLFQTSRRLADAPQFALHKLLASAIVLLTPTGFAAVALLLLGRGSSTADAGELDRVRASRFLKTATLTPVAVFIVFSLRHEVKLDWTGAPWLGVVPLLAAGIVQSASGVASGLRALIRAAWVPTIGILLLVYGAGLYDLAIGIPGLGYGRHAELVPVGWRELGAKINTIAEGVGREAGGHDPLVVGMDRYAIASELAFYRPDRPSGVGHTSSAHLFGQVGLMYERWFPVAAQTGRTLLLVAWKPDDLDADGIARSVNHLEPIQQGVLIRGAEVIRPFYYRIAEGYRGAPVP